MRNLADLACLNCIRVVLEHKKSAKTRQTNVASRFDRFDNSICQQTSKQIEQLSKQAELMTRQNETIVQSIKAYVICDSRSVGKFATAGWGQPQNWQPLRFQAPSLLISVRL